jgi:hypothetical protein
VVSHFPAFTGTVVDPTGATSTISIYDGFSLTNSLLIAVVFLLLIDVIRRLFAPHVR